MGYYQASLIKNLTLLLVKDLQSLSFEVHALLSDNTLLSTCISVISTNFFFCLTTSDQSMHLLL